MKKLSLIGSLTLVFLVSPHAQSAKQTPISTFAEFEGAQIHYYDVGKGEKALVLIHGWACNGDFWKYSMELPGYRVIAIDLPGHGRSDKPRVDYTMDYFARSIAAVMGDAGINKAVLVGHSMGAGVIRRFYWRYPQQTLGLVFVDNSLRAEMTKESQEEMEQLIAPLRANYKENSAKFIEQTLRLIRDEGLKDEIRSAMLATPDYVALSALEAGGTDDGSWMSDTIGVPVLAILADAPWRKPGTEEYFHSIAPEVDFQMWQGVSHFLMMERPADFNEALKRFVSREGLL